MVAYRRRFAGGEIDRATVPRTSIILAQYRRVIGAAENERGRVWNCRFWNLDQSRETQKTNPLACGRIGRGPKTPPAPRIAQVNNLYEWRGYSYAVFAAKTIGKYDKPDAEFRRAIRNSDAPPQDTALTRPDFLPNWKERACK